jgi:hypothetical protein
MHVDALPFEPSASFIKEICEAAWQRAGKIELFSGRMQGGIILIAADMAMIVPRFLIRDCTVS